MNHWSTPKGLLFGDGKIDQLDKGGIPGSPIIRHSPEGTVEPENAQLEKEAHVEMLVSGVQIEKNRTHNGWTYCRWNILG